MRLELVVENAGRAPIIVVSIPEPAPGPGDSFTSLHLVDCPPSTGLSQRYDVIGQRTPPDRPVAINGISGIAAQTSEGQYLIVIIAEPTLADRWTVLIGGDQVGGGLGSSFVNLPTSGERSEAGCFFSP